MPTGANAGTAGEPVNICDYPLYRSLNRAQPGGDLPKTEALAPPFRYNSPDQIRCLPTGKFFPERQRGSLPTLPAP